MNWMNYNSIIKHKAQKLQQTNNIGDDNNVTIIINTTINKHEGRHLNLKYRMCPYSRQRYWTWLIGLSIRAMSHFPYTFPIYYSTTSQDQFSIKFRYSRSKRLLQKKKKKKKNSLLLHITTHKDTRSHILNNKALAIFTNTTFQNVENNLQYLVTL